MKRKININRPGISSEEIAQRKNFDSVLKNNSMNVGPKSLLKKPWFLSGVVVATIAVVTTVLLLNQKPKTLAEKTSAEAPVASVTDNSALQAFYKAEQSKPCIAPPIKGLNVPYIVYKVNAQKGGTLDFKTGSKLMIPKNAFADQNGNPVKGEVELRYREFHDAVDFFASGIPMTYDSAGVKYHFRSAGMLEMLAYQDGKQVNMAPGKTIDVQLASNDNGTEYNLYKLDTVKNNWSCLGKDKVVSKPATPAVQPKDTEEQTVAQTPEYQQVETQKAEAKTTEETQIAALPKVAAEPKKPIEGNKSKYIENLDVSYDEFPEIAQFKGVEWQVGDENKDFNAQTHDMLTKVEWEDIAVKEGPKKGENYIITLTKGAKKYSFTFYPVFEGKNYAKAVKDFQDKFNKYTVALDKRKVDEQKIEDEYQAKILALKQKQEELERKWKAEMNRQIQTMTAQEKVMRVFSMSSFGVYNSDCAGGYPRGISCNATLTNQSGVSLMCYNVFLVDKKRAGLFTYYQNPLTTFAFDPASDNILWTVDDGKLYYLKPEGFAAIKNGEQHIKLNKQEEDFKTVEDMKAFFNL